MNNKNKYLTSLALSIMFLLSIGFMSAAAFDITLQTPAESASLAGAAQMLNSTIENPAGDAGPYNVSFYYQVAGESTWTLISTVTNTSANQASFNTTWDTTAIVDQLNLTINATSRDLVNAINSSSATLLHPLDNGNPTATLSSSTFTNEKNVFVDDSFTVGLDADATIGISSCLVYFTNENDNSVTTKVVSASANACATTTNAEDESLGIHNYGVIMEATDANSNKTNSSERRLFVTSRGGGGGIAISQTQFVGDTGLDRAQSSIGNVSESIRNFIVNIFDKIRSLFS